MLSQVSLQWQTRLTFKAFQRQYLSAVHNASAPRLQCAIGGIRGRHYEESRRAAPLATIARSRILVFNFDAVLIPQD